MSREQVFEKLNEIFRDVFDDESITVGEETTAKDVEGWDSLANINLIVSMEGEFDIKFTMQEITGLKNVGEIADVIMERAQG